MKTQESAGVTTARFIMVEQQEGGKTTNGNHVEGDPRKLQVEMAWSEGRGGRGNHKGIREGLNTFPGGI